MDKSILMLIANNLSTSYRSKGHGGYKIYEDEKIQIMYDTYYPNVEVNIFVDGEKKLVALYSGHGYTQEFHSGAWCNYVENTLLPKAKEAKAKKEVELELKKQEDHRRKFSSVDDKHVFA